MATIQTQIWMALKQRVVSIPGGYAIAITGEDFERITVDSPLEPYVQVENLPNRPRRFLIDSDGPHDRLGILTLSLMWPVAKPVKTEVIKEKAGLIAAHFPVDLYLNFQDASVRIYEAPEVVDPFRDDAYWRCPISIRWQVYI